MVAVYNTFGQVMWTMLVFFTWILFFWLLFAVFGDLFRRSDISEADLEAAALADEAVQRALEGKQVRKVIVRAPKLVNVVAG